MLLSTLVLALTPLALCNQAPESSSHKSDWPALSSLLDTIDSTVLHGVLHQLSPKFQDGVFSKDRSAIEHVHSEDPIVATKLVHIALKRQASNATTTAQSVAPSVSSELSAQITASTPPPPTTIAVAPTTPPSATPVSTGDGYVVFSTIGGGLVTVTSGKVPVSFVPSSSTTFRTTTLPNGQVETLTSVVLVNAPHTGTVGAEGAAQTTGGNPGLQDAGSFVRISAGLMACMAIGCLALLL